jgi:transcription-repair coupling factor (superfamily II helicase)
MFLYPPDEEFPFAHASRHPEITSQKIEVLHHLTNSDQPPIIVAPITALLRKSIPRAVTAFAVVLWMSFHRDTLPPYA